MVESHPLIPGLVREVGPATAANQIYPHLPTASASAPTKPAPELSDAERVAVSPLSVFAVKGGR